MLLAACAASSIALLPELSSVPAAPYCATSASVEAPPVVPVPLLLTAIAPTSGKTGRVVGVAYRTLMVQVAVGASDVAFGHVVPVML